MINFSILISSSKISGPGGLFDIDATLPLVALQFLLIMVILNLVLYSPVLKVIEERQEYILTNLSKASKIVSQANQETRQYEEELDDAREEAQLIITASQQRYKKLSEIQLDTSQLYIDKLSYKFEKDICNRKALMVGDLMESVLLLCDSIETRLAI